MKRSAASGASTPETAPAPENDEDEDAGNGSKGGKSGSGLLSSDLEYTSSELEEAKREQRDNIKSLELDLKESDIKIRQAERALEKGVVTANMNGVVKTAGDPAAPPTDGSAFLTVAGADGLYIKSGIKESLFGTLQVGDKVSIASWSSGNRYEAEIKSISPYPDSGDMYGGEGETYYPPFFGNRLRCERTDDHETFCPGRGQSKVCLYAQRGHDAQKAVYQDRNAERRRI